MNETPPSASAAPIVDHVLRGPGVLLSRALVYLVLLLFLSAGVWATSTRMDVVVYARGRLIVRGEPIRISVPESGLVVEVPFQVGDHVNEGDLLLRLDTFKYRSDTDQTQKDIAALLAEATRYREGAQAVRQTLRLTGEEMDIARRAATIVAEQLKRLERLAADQIVSVADVQQKALELNDATGRVARFETALKQAENDAAEKDQQAAEARARASALTARIAQLGGLENRLFVRAPVAGTITQLAVLHPGSVIEPGQPAALITPDKLPLLAAIQIPNASMRRLQAGMPVRMRFDAFPYQDFGDLVGRLERIEPDADPAGSYRAWVSLGRGELDGSRGNAKLQPGLFLDAEVIVDRRTMLEFALRPFKRLAEPIRVGE